MVLRFPILAKQGWETTKDGGGVYRLDLVQKAKVRGRQISKEP